MVLLVLGFIFLALTNRESSPRYLALYSFGAVPGCFLGVRVFEWCYTDASGVLQSHPQDIRLYVAILTGFALGSLFVKIVESFALARE